MRVAVLILLLIVLIVLRSNKLKSQGIKEIQFKEGGVKMPKKGEGKNSLLKILDNISSGNKVILKNVTEKIILNKNTIDEDLKEQLKIMITLILNSINGMTNHTFHVNTIENVYITKDDAGNFRCILNCFIFEVSKYYTIKLSMDIVSYDEEIFFNSIDIDESSLSTILNKYDIKWDGMGILSKHNMFSENVKDILDNYYKNNYNVISFHNKDPNIDKTSLFTMNQLRNNYLPSSYPRNKEHPYFCKKNANKWGNRGISVSTYKNCISQDNTYEGYPIIPRNIPGAITQNPDNNIYRTLFNPSMGPLKSSGQY